MKRIYSKIVLVALLFSAVYAPAMARECTQCKLANAKNAAVRTKAAGCKRAQSSAQLDVNNVRARINGYGNMWYDGSNPQYHIPKDENTCPLYCAALWVGGTDVNDQLRLAALSFGQYGDDFWPGPLKIDNTASITPEVCIKYDQHWRITKAEVQDHMAKFTYGENNVVTSNGDVGNIPDVIVNWPASGDGDDLTRYLAPFYDADGDGEYHPEQGDYPYYDFTNELCPRTKKANLKPGAKYTPDPTMETSAKIVTGGLLSDQVLKGDQTIWWVFNDKGNTHTETQGNEIGLEIRAQAFAFSTNDEINNMTFYSYEIINRSTYTLANTYFSQWVDPDLGFAKDDYVGCDVRRGLGYCYNGDEQDGPGAGSYSGIPPAVGIDFFQGPYMDPDGKDNPKINIPYILQSGSPELRALLEKYKYFDSTYNMWCYDTISISDDADLFFNTGKDGYKSWYFVKDDVIGNCAINGVNFGNNIIDDERFGMRRFVFYNNYPYGNTNTQDPSRANDYYNYLRGYWKDNKRMKYGGDAYTATQIDPANLDCDFMFPGDSDPWHWGTNGEVPTVNPNDWNEITAGNSAGDRRFMQSAGPFTLKPGALNYITVGIPYAKASSGNAWSSVEKLREIDDVCQSLFENCFKVLDGPEAPTMTCQELKNEVILYLHYDNIESNNYNEKYSEIDPKIVKTYTKTTVKDTTYTIAEIDTIIGFDTTYRYIPKTTTYSVDSTKYYTEDQRSYKFEGYMIYQLKDASVSIADIGDITKARLLFQCDIENYYDSVDADGKKNTNPSLPIGKLVNYTQNSATGLLTGKVMVDGANQGIQHVFRVTTDLFATGANTKLVNNREYYYIAIAYAQNRYKEYSQTEATYLDGQKEPYLAGRKNEKGKSITPIVAIPHDPIVEDGGKVAQAEFGMCPTITRLEGYGNGGSVLRLSEGSIAQLMGEPGQPAVAPGTLAESFSYVGVDNSHMNNPAIIAHPEYIENYGPVNVSVIDPLKIREGKYNIMFKNVAGGSGVNDNTRWFIVKINDDGSVQDTIWSDFSISRKNEQLFLDLGIAITLVDPIPTATDLNDPKYSDNGQYYFGGSVNSGALLGASMTFADKTLQWLSGIPDNDASPVGNWIRSGIGFAANTYAEFYGGTSKYDMYENYLDEDYFKAYEPTWATTTSDYKYVATDENQIFERVLSGTWSPYALVSTRPFHPGFNFSYYMPEEKVLDSLEDPTFYAWSFSRYSLERKLLTNFYNRSLNYSDMSQLPSVRIVFTADTTKWTRCPVIEMCDDHTQAEGNARKFSARRHPSVDKMGRYIGGEGKYAYTGTADVNDPSNPAYISETGMGWFPGYAINTVTGERLNIMFGEDSRYVQFNGRDMMWNPVSTYVDGTENYVFGGRHFIYIMNACNQPFASITKSTPTNDVSYYRTPSYDAGRWAIKMLRSAEHMMNIRETSAVRNFYAGFIGDGAELGSPIPVRDSIALLYASVAWVNMPLANSRYEFNYPGNNAELNSGKPCNGIPTDLTVDIDVRVPYNINMSQNLTTSAHCGVASANGSMPAYQFRITSEDAVLENLATRKDAEKEYVDSILNLISIVPNPYYSYDNYETGSQLETKVRIINLPTGLGKSGQKEGCYVKIYTVDGTLVRTLGPTDPSDEHGATTLDWDLHNHTGLPIAGGMYLIHVTVPGMGERVIKWFGTMRPVDLNSFQF